MEDSRIRNLLDKFEKFREKNNKTFDIEFGNNLLDSLNALFIIPELDRRKKREELRATIFQMKYYLRLNSTKSQS